jgi:hypothetical protein
VRKELARQQVVAQQAYAWFKSPPALPKKKVTARLKKPPVYARAAIAAAAPLGHGDDDDDGTDTDDTDDHAPFTAANKDDDDFDRKTAAKDIRFPDTVDDVEDDDENDNDDDKDDADDNDVDDDNDGDGDGDNDEPEIPAIHRQSKSHKKRPSRASRGLLQSTLKKKISREIKTVCEGQLLYNRTRSATIIQ